eukprot:gene6682-13537_t
MTENINDGRPFYSRLSLRSGKEHVVNAVTGTFHHIVEEVRHECTPNISKFSLGGTAKAALGLIYRPYVPAFHRPGWFKNYIVGPHTPELLESLFSDLWAGVIVALTLLPQGLSYSQLANLPAVNGLYAAILPSATYTFLGSSMQLGVGPVAIVSLLTGQLVSKYRPDYAKNPEGAINLAAQISLVCGLYLLMLAAIKAGNLINYISHPVMSGFTSGAAMLIGLSQLKNAFGFPSAAPQTGQEGYHYNYEVMEWFLHNWNNADVKTKLDYVNPFAAKITFGIYIPLILMYFLKECFPATPERKKNIYFKVFTYIVNIMPLFAIVIGANIAEDLITNAGTDPYKKAIKTVGNLPSGVNILRTPVFTEGWGPIFADVLPLTLISFMESYSVARRIATQRNELWILNANQELFAIGVANCLGSVSSAFPVSGSFSRSSLNAASGAKTPLSKATTMSIICLSLAAFTTKFYYIPNAALAAIIWVAITALISPLDFWEAWKHSKRDFFVLLTTFSITFILNTEYGLMAGIVLSFLIWFYDTAVTRKQVASFAPDTEMPVAIEQSETLLALKGVEYIRLYADISFVNVHFMKAYIIEEVLESKSEHITAILVDFADTSFIDLTGLLNFKEIVKVCHLKGVKFGAINMIPSVEAAFTKFEIEVDTFDSINTDSKQRTPDIIAVLTAEDASSKKASNSSSSGGSWTHTAHDTHTAQDTHTA